MKKRKELPYKGILEDNRPKAEKNKNFDVREVSMGEVRYVSKEQAILNAQNYIFRNQWYKSSCVPSSICNALWNTEKVELADEPWYSTRVNKPMEGCYWYDIADKAVKNAYLRSDCAESRLETDVNAYKIPTGIDSKTHRQKSYIFIDNSSTDMNLMVSLINSGLSVAWSFFSIRQEWAVETPHVIKPELTIEKATINHAICAIPNTGYLDEDDLPCFIITDSAWFGNIHTRHITKQFFDARFKHGVFFADLDIVVSTEPNLPKFTFTRNLTNGSTGEDVKTLQIVLRELGLMSKYINGVQYEPTTYFGGLTRKGVADYQTKNGIKPAVGYFGPVTRASINKLTNK